MPSKRSRIPLLGDAIVLENAEMRLEINSTGTARSLVHKPSGQECLARDVEVPMFTLTQDRPYDNELQLAYPAEVTHFAGTQVRRESNNLLVEFDLIGYSASIVVKITDAYIAFSPGEADLPRIHVTALQAEDPCRRSAVFSIAGAHAEKPWPMVERHVG